MELIIHNLSKNYRKKEAVKDINMNLTPGIWGLLGANGAGKTTLMRMMAGILEPTKGNVLFCGKDIRHNRLYRASFGFLPQEIQFGRDLTVYDYLEYVAALKNIPQRETKMRINRLLHVLTLEDVRHKKIVKLSGGMKRRVGIAQAMLNDPKVLILDEPTAGLDPGERIRFRNFLAETSSERIIILSTHIVSDIEDIADYVMIMKEGSLNRTVSRSDYDDLEELYINIFMNGEDEYEAV
ncbi:MAG: ABC transporter ATP-binding protein [Eubacterium sp.]|nr:ABC transporter ATP-binding protein [Eubacterium sp.]